MQIFSKNARLQQKLGTSVVCFLRNIYDENIFIEK